MKQHQLPFSTTPQPVGLYSPANEHDACGMAMVASLRQAATHEVIDTALNALRNLEHRGAVGSDEGTGDGAGINVQMPHTFLDAVTDFALPNAGEYAAGLIFLPTSSDERAAVKDGIQHLAAEDGLTVLGWREVPIRPEVIGTLARDAMPKIEQLFVSKLGLSGPSHRGIELDRLVYPFRKRIEHEYDVYLPSLSSRTIVYKGMVTTLQLEPFYPDLSDQRFTSKLALVHSRYSTNTFPSWPLAQPFRFIAHNGEINTVQGNRNWMQARQGMLKTSYISGLDRAFPIVTPGASDSASFDEVLELLELSGRKIYHALLMMIPEAWEKQTGLDPDLRAFYEYHATMLEPWDGPAAVVFTDGRYCGATLDRNGLRPGRYQVTDDGLVVVASEIGVHPVDPIHVVKKGRIEPGKLFLIDTEEGRFITDSEVKHELAHMKPWQDWLNSSQINLRDLPEREHISHTRASVVRRQRTFGYTEEDLKMLLGPMATNGVEPIGAMGNDAPVAVLNDRPRAVFDYFTQAFAQVTNPPLDSIREEVVTTMRMGLGPQQNLLALDSQHHQQIVLDFPVIDNDELAKVQHLDDASGREWTVSLRGVYPAGGGVDALRTRLAELCEEATDAVNRGAHFLVLSDRDSNADYAPIPSLLMISAVHHHLIRSQLRPKVGIIVETGDVRSVHQTAMLIGFGASAVNPYLAMESCEDMVRSGEITGVSAEVAVHHLIKALGKGVLKIMSKMGISAVASYTGAQTFEAVGLSQDLVDDYFTGTVTKLGGVDLAVIEEENAARHRVAYPERPASTIHQRLPSGGDFHWRRDGTPHLFNPETVFRLQHATRTGQYAEFKKYTQLVDDQSKTLYTLRGLLGFKKGNPVPLDEVESVADIVKRFSTGAMSYGSISQEAHETLAIAMNALGGKSNTGEGGEDLERLLDPQRRSAIKQVASARFGVTSMYLTHADDIQIKLAQGAKPGEGGQLPPQKMYPWIARTRHSTPGVGLISPPPHHDIYSIEDLKQLIFDLKRANNHARIHVKLVSENGIGAVAAGVAKAKADVILVSGQDGGTGATPLNSMKHAGTPWEIGLAEVQQTLMLNGMRSRVVVQTDGQLKTGRDVVIAALLGAEEFGFATAPLVVEGCIMMRVCNKDTCPVGVATQNPELRKRFTGKPEFVINFFKFIAEEVREHMAALGFRTIDEMVGHNEFLEASAALEHWKTQDLDLTPILHGPIFDDDEPRRHLIDQDHELEKHFDNELIRLSYDALEHGEPVRIEMNIRNTERAVGTMLGSEVTRAYGEDGLPDDTIDIVLRGSAGQSFGAFMPRGITLRLIGDSNDYLGKGLSGGEIIVRNDPTSPLVPRDNVIAGNVIGYGATSGRMFISGLVGERFMVRNSGATAVVEGVGDHALEYMTGGRVVIMGSIGRNLGAGMSGGYAYVQNLTKANVNTEAVASGELLLQPLAPDDIAELRDLLEAHRAATDSTLAEELLREPNALAQQFTKVLPRDFATVLDTRKHAVAEGLDPDGEVVWERILEATNG